MRDIVKSASNEAEGCARLHKFITSGIAEGKFKADQVSHFELAHALGIVDPLAQHESISEFVHQSRGFNPERRAELYFHESNPGLLTNTFQVLTQELLSSVVIEGYNDEQGYIGDQLCTTMASPNRRNLKMPGVTKLGGMKEVAEGHPYEDTGFQDKWVSTHESKRGRTLRISEETLMFDQTGLVNMQARELGAECRADRERQIVRGVLDADSGSGKYVYRPGGVAEALYSGANLNLIGSGGVTDYTTAVPLIDWTDINEVRVMRATKVTDDRVDGTPRPIPGLNSGQNIILVPISLDATARYITASTGGDERTNSGARVTDRNNPVAGFVSGVLSSELLDEVSTTTWYYGNPKKQFVWVECMPVQTFVQGADSEAAFERDTIMAIKVRYYGGLTARDTVYTTKVLGA